MTMTPRINFRNLIQIALRWSIVAVAISVFVYGIAWRSANLLAVGAVILCFILRRSWDVSRKTPNRPQRGSRRIEGHRAVRAPSGDEIEPATGSEPESFKGLADRNELPKSTDVLVDELLLAGRYALMLRPETKRHLTQPQVMRAIRQLDEAMALVPAGRVLLGQLAEMTSSACGQFEIDPKLSERNLIMVAPLYLDRFCVTNAEYQKFIDAAGYEEL